MTQGSDNYWAHLNRERATHRRFVRGAGMTSAGAAALGLDGCGVDHDNPSPPSSTSRVGG